MNFFSYLKVAKRNCGLILLNTPIENYKIFDVLWNNAITRVFLDGFANIIHSKMLENVYVPNILIGDFDSIKPEILNYYHQKENVNVILAPDQDYTDLDKGLKYLIDNNKKLENIIIHFKAGGRLDHTFAMFSSLFEVKKYSNIEVCLISDCDISVLLSPGDHNILIDHELAEGTCGLIPLGDSVVVSTSGLKWNLCNEELKFGKLISSSNNLLDSKEVNISCNNFLVLTLCYLTPNS